ncbi:hypothetical protein PsorP6_000880 [Peronosclerospora sorghi]|uniref:Uncharacterized protein n=1 Tax=Peronosclerospora sorghi TaxID=230839 RepID=A0ACC0WR49_9STRA|nr:hypothetical protein PsorP6_000880 [Peronosclerospora sorghi]
MRGDARIVLTTLIQEKLLSPDVYGQVVEPDDSSRSVTVLDVKGFGTYDLGEVLDFLSSALLLLPVPIILSAVPILLSLTFLDGSTLFGAW